MIYRLVISMGGRVVSAATQVAIFALLARSLGVENFGLFSLVFGVAIFTLSVFDLGMGTRVLRGLRKSDERSALTTYSIVRAVLIILIPVIAVCVSTTTSAEPILLVAASLYAVGDATGDVAVNIRQGLRASGSAMAILLVRRIATLTPLLLFQDFHGAYLSMAAAFVVGVTAYAVCAWPLMGRAMSLKTLVMQNLTIVASGGAANVSQLDVSLVGVAAGPTAAGLYGAGIRLFNPINLAVTTMLQVLVPELAHLSDDMERKRQFVRARRVVIALAVVVAALSCVAPQLVIFLYGVEFEDAAPVAVAVFIAASLSAVGQLHLSWFYAVGVPRVVPVGMWVAALAGLSTISILTVNFSIAGAAIGLVVMQALTAAAIVIPCEVGIRRLG